MAPARPIKGLGPEADELIKTVIETVYGEYFPEDEAGHDAETARIDGADDIEVEFILDNEVQKFNAEIVQSDKVNDLAIIKIVDVNFDGVKELPYNFKTRSSDVGTKVYAYGYPMALSIMGKEIKVTDV